MIPTDRTIPTEAMADMANHDLAVIGQAVAHALMPGIHELAGLMAKPRATWVRPSDRIATPTGTATTTVQRIVERQLDRLRFTLTNVSTTTTLYVCSATASQQIPGAAVNAFPVAAGGTLTLDTKVALSAFTLSGSADWAAIVETIDL